MNEQEKSVLLTKTLSPGPAHIIRSALEAHDIPCTVIDDHPSGLGVGIGIVDARIFVPESYQEEAIKLLRELEEGNK